VLLPSSGTFLAVLVCRPDLFTFLVFVFVRTGQDVANHSGWEFGRWSPWNWIPGHAPTTFHDTHHYRSGYAGHAKNLATTLVVWDKLFGTYAAASARAPIPKAAM
jgi:sterol desaturase/sphingolipid hydroxylase (fatty acid hydroxylase superfamily)